jgi:hypothetical protein
MISQSPGELIPEGTDHSHESAGIGNTLLDQLVTLFKNSSLLNAPPLCQVMLFKMPAI